MASSIQAALKDHRDFFFRGQTKEREFRLEQLSKLGEALRTFETEIFAALKSDLGKSSFESFVAEVAFLHEEIKVCRKNL